MAKNLVFNVQSFYKGIPENALIRIRQVARVEAVALERARKDFEVEKQALQTKTEAEIHQIQTHLKLLQKVDQYMTKVRSESGQCRYSYKSLSSNSLFCSIRLLRTQLIKF